MSGRNRLPFTPSQWQELEHQALIFRYMVSGVPIPPDLLFTVKRSLDSSLPSKLILHEPQHIGWNCFQMGFGRKIDPEPWRCRRTDGKKWRCSKEAYPDSKYCERHMHRGRNRSRKPVEVVTTTTTATTTTAATINSSTTQPPTIPISSITRNPVNPSTYTQSSLSSIPSNTHHYHHHNHPCYSNSTTQLHHPYLYDPHSSSRLTGMGLSSYDNASHLLLDSALSSHADKDYRNRYGDGMKEGVDEHALFSETSGIMTSYSGSSIKDSWQLTPLTMGSPVPHLKQRSYSGLQNGCLNLQMQGLTDSSKQQKQDQQHFYALGGSDVKCEMSLKIERDDEPQKVMHHFLDEWPPRNKDSWLESDDKSSTTQLSISIPNSSHDFFMTQHDK